MKYMSLGNIAHIFHLIFIPFFWFIVLICSLYLLVPALRIFVQAAKKWDILLVILLWFLAICILPFVRNTQAFPLHVGDGVVQLVVNFIGYFLLGFLVTQIKPQKKYLIGIGILFILSLIGRGLLAYLPIYHHGSDFIDPALVVASVSLFSLLYFLEDVFQRFFNNF